MTTEPTPSAEAIFTLAYRKEHAAELPAARDLYVRVQQDYPGSSWAVRAAEALARLDARAQGPERGSSSNDVQRAKEPTTFWGALVRADWAEQRQAGKAAFLRRETMLWGLGLGVPLAWLRLEREGYTVATALTWQGLLRIQLFLAVVLVVAHIGARFEWRRRERAFTGRDERL
jgi:hypothetical protein